MNKCLVTKLNSVVENSNLRKIGFFQVGITISSPVTGKAYMLPSTAGKVNLLSNGAVFTDNSGNQNYGISYDYPERDNLYFKFTGTDVSTVSYENSNKYNLEAFDLTSSGYTYSDITLGVNNDLSEFEYCLNLKRLVLGTKCKASGDVSSLLKSSKLEHFETPLNITGKYSDFGKFPALKNVYSDSTTLKGNVEEYVSVAINNNKAIKYLNYRLPNMYFGSTLLPYENSKINYESLSKIYVDVGTNKIYAKGCSESEISEWTSGGKTVTVIK